MKKRIIKGSVVGLWLALSPILSAGDTPISLFGHLGNEQKRAQSLKPINHAEIEKQITEISYTPVTFAYLELQFKTSPLLAEKNGELNGAITLEVMSQTPEALTRVSVRLIDKNGEVFQTSSPLLLRKGIWIPIAVELNPHIQFESIFGGDKNRQIDFPVRLSGLTVGFDKNFEGTGNIFLRNAAWHSDK